MKFLIIPGFAKAGTTFLFEALKDSGAPINIPIRKEVDYLRGGNDKATYLAQFESQDSDKVFLDASPMYSMSGQDTIRNIKKCLKADDVKVLFCLRDSISRAYSHYMHDICTHFFLYAHGPYSFYSPAVLRYYFKPIAPVIASYIKSFGAENVSAFGFKSTGQKLPTDVLDFLSLPKTWKLDLSKNPALGGALPRIYYDKDRYLTVRSGADLYALPPRNLLISNIRFQQLRTDFPVKIAQSMLKSAASWDRQFDPTVLGDALDIIREDYAKCFELLGINPEKANPVSDIWAKEPGPLTPEICNKMERLGSVSSTVKANMLPPKKLSLKKMDTKDVAYDKHATLPDLIDNINAVKKSSSGQRSHHYAEGLKEFGPIPDYVKGYFRHLIMLGDADSMLAYLEQNPNLDRYISFKLVLDDLAKMKHKFEPEQFNKLCRYMGQR